MERQSSKHNPRVDDSMKKEAEALLRSEREARTTESRLAEPPADGEPTPDPIVSSSIGNASLTHDEVELRQDLARFLDTTIWPATREGIVENAASHRAPDRVLELFGRLPPGAYEGFPNVWEAISGHREPRKI